MIENIEWFPASTEPQMKELYRGGPLTSGWVLIKTGSGSVITGKLEDTNKTKTRRWESTYAKGIKVNFWAYMPKGPEATHA